VREDSLFMVRGSHSSFSSVREVGRDFPMLGQSWMCCVLVIPHAACTLDRRIRYKLGLLLVVRLEGGLVL
jgi:hypothetical protein